MKKTATMRRLPSEKKCDKAQNVSVENPGAFAFFAEIGGNIYCKLRYYKLPYTLLPCRCPLSAPVSPSASF